MANDGGSQELGNIKAFPAERAAAVEPNTLNELPRTPDGNIKLGDFLKDTPLATVYAITHVGLIQINTHPDQQGKESPIEVSLIPPGEEETIILGSLVLDNNTETNVIPEVGPWKLTINPTDEGRQAAPDIVNGDEFMVDASMFEVLNLEIDSGRVYDTALFPLGAQRERFTSLLSDLKANLLGQQIRAHQTHNDIPPMPTDPEENWPAILSAMDSMTDDQRDTYIGSLTDLQQLRLARAAFEQGFAKSKTHATEPSLNTHPKFASLTDAQREEDWNTFLEELQTEGEQKDSSHESELSSTDQTKMLHDGPGKLSDFSDGKDPEHGFHHIGHHSEPGERAAQTKPLAALERIQRARVGMEDDEWEHSDFLTTDPNMRSWPPLRASSLADIQASFARKNGSSSGDAPSNYRWEDWDDLNHTVQPTPRGVANLPGIKQALALYHRIFQASHPKSKF